jgi:hypothetical protein
MGMWEELATMPVHDWTRVEAGIFHDFHHAWIEEIKRSLNAGVLPEGYYALAEQHTAGFGPDVLTLQGDSDDLESGGSTTVGGGNGGLLLAPPKLAVTAEAEFAFYRRKQSRVVVRHVTGDEIVAMVEIVSPGNKIGKNALRAFVQKAAELLERQIHLLILDLHPPGPRDPSGIHALIWEELTNDAYSLPPGKPLTLAAYESDLAIRAFVEHCGVGDNLIDMPLFLKRDGQVPVPLERTYQAAFAVLPGRWRSVLEAPRPSV